MPQTDEERRKALGPAWNLVWDICQYHTQYRHKKAYEVAQAALDAAFKRGFAAARERAAKLFEPPCQRPHPNFAKAIRAMHCEGGE